MSEDNDSDKLLSQSKKLHDKLAPYATKGPVSRRREAAIRCLERYGSCDTLAEKLHVYNEEYGNAEGMATFDALSRLGFAVGSQEKKWYSFESYEWVIKQIFSYEDAPFLLIGGQLSSGKTSTSLLLAVRAVELGIKDKIGTNIKSVADQREYINRIDTWTDLEEWLETDGKKVYVFDEAKKQLTKRRAMSKSVLKFSNKGDLLRKYRTHMVLIAPLTEELDSQFHKKLTNVKVEKKSKKQAVFDIEGNHKLRNSIGANPLRFNNIPDAPINFDTYEVSEFEMDIDDDEGEDRRTIGDAVENALKNEAKKPPEDRKSLTWIANYLGCTQGYVSQRKSKLEAEGKIEW
ncbi:hypothetical protein AKJ49_01325 [candidate division MSBL1 archaeon SCGC-AAA382A03]|uniref:Uncharacterized protein n=1 Tax=candidate division MSBL1 archaeon SCGC-AAA382A03 TaxID=1698278 RepID=A0A133VFI4_9EURY|nr:hypothetical protein AKJ49_01325 [candidate division MSBL1 archaeon SCGC-AAA382A03]